MLTAREIIESLQLAPLPIEGGYFRQTWASDDVIAEAALPSRYRGAKPAGTAIYYLLTSEAGNFSAFHRLPTDEVYHFYMGDPVEQWLLHEDGHIDRVVLGQNIASGQHVQHVAPRGAWQGSRLVHGGRVALLGTTMAPGFDASDYEPGRRDDLAARYPAAADVIRALTR